MNRIALLALAIGLMVWGLGCGSHRGPQPRSSNTPSEFQARDDFGETIALAKAPQRIVCLAPNVAEIIFALGLGDRVVGVSEFCDYPPEAKLKPSIGRYDRPSIEKIVSLHPDLVFLGYGNPRDLPNALRNSGILTFGVNPKNIAGILDVINRMGQICGVPERAGELTKVMQQRLEKVSKRLKVGGKHPRVFILVDENPLWTAGSNTLQDEILRRAGGANVAAAKPSYFPFSTEALLAAQPEVLLLMAKPADSEKLRQRILARKDLASLPAIRKRQIIILDPDIFSRPSPRAIDAIEQLADSLAKYR